MAWWYLSFSDGDKPAGEKFQGACFVEAGNEIGAARVATEKGINPFPMGKHMPGGIMVIPVPDTFIIPPNCKNRLLTHDQLDNTFGNMNKIECLVTDDGPEIISPD